MKIIIALLLLIAAFPAAAADTEVGEGLSKIAHFNHELKAEKILLSVSNESRLKIIENFYVSSFKYMCETKYKLVLKVEKTREDVTQISCGEYPIVEFALKERINGWFNNYSVHFTGKNGNFGSDDWNYADATVELCLWHNYHSKECSKDNK